MQAPPPAAGSGWLPTLLSVLGLLGGLGGVAAIGTVLVQRRKFKADAADVISDAAISLVAPLRARVAELETEADGARRKVVAAKGEVDRLRDKIGDMTRLLLRLRDRILADPTASPELREMVRSAPGPGDVNGRM
jgi:outer membrane murein-binding lipoprotein Lpp